MQIRFEKSGGFAAIRRPPKIISVDSLPERDAAEWRRLIEAADFFNLPSVIPPGHGRDLFQYAITVDLDGRQHCVRVSEGAVPAPLQPLLERLQQAAQG
jgi:hypothetical protein